MAEFVHVSGKDNILQTVGELRTSIGQPVLLMPMWGRERTLADPFALPPGVQRKDREGNVLPPEPTAFEVFHDPHIFEAVGAISLTLTLDTRGGAHIAQLPDNRHFVDLMSPNPDMLRHGTGEVAFVAGGGWVGESVDLTLGDPHRFIMTDTLKNRGGPVFLGIGLLNMDDLSLPVRREAHPAEVHFQRPQPIPFF